MKKHFAEMVALCCLCLLAAMPALAGDTLPVPDDEALLALFFPGQTLEPVQDFFYALGEHDPANASAPYGYRNIYRVKEKLRFDEKMLVVIEGHGIAHSEGYHNFIFGVFGLREQALLGEPLMTMADRAEYYPAFRDGVLSIVYVGGTMGQGLEGWQGGRWAWDDAAKTWNLRWPANDATSEAYSDFWMRRKGEIDQETPGAMRTYTLITEGEDTYHWEYEGVYDPFAQ